MNELLIFNRRIVQNISSERGEEFDSGFGETSAKLQPWRLRRKARWWVGEEAQNVNVYHAQSTLVLTTEIFAAAENDFDRLKSMSEGECDRCVSIAISINDGRASLPGRLRSGIFVDPKENIISFAKSGSPRLIPSKESLFLVFFADQWMENIGSRRFVIIKGKDCGVFARMFDLTGTDILEERLEEEEDGWTGGGIYIFRLSTYSTIRKGIIVRTRIHYPSNYGFMPEIHPNSYPDEVQASLGLCWADRMLYHKSFGLTDNKGVICARCSQDWCSGEMMRTNRDEYPHESRVVVTASRGRAGQTVEQYEAILSSDVQAKHVKPEDFDVVGYWLTPDPSAGIARLQFITKTHFDLIPSGCITCTTAGRLCGLPLAVDIPLTRPDQGCPNKVRPD
ncbi:hypothetical protein M747DRAFT_317270 [Aspergillus niger ATCC 13496]|uniref:Uncharacterized protein n=1 Tax=Aspergillus niger ATCC 13496 TaxID=1353008 RepID=A0A370BS21_ASPNG|nr:hypothetical protein M747DRAFT_317270 [Aspergillus niger ATCC 13496]